MERFRVVIPSISGPGIVHKNHFITKYHLSDVLKKIMFMRELVQSQLEYCPFKKKIDAKNENMN